MARNQLSPEAKRALAYWGVIELAAETGATTRDLWSWIHDEAEAKNLGSPGVTVRGVSELRGRAGRIQEAGRQFRGLDDNRRIRGEHVATPPWARDPGQQKAQPRYAVRYKHTFERGGQVLTEWRTSVFNGRPNVTAGQLRRDVELDASNNARGAGSGGRAEHMGTSDHQVLVF